MSNQPRFYFGGARSKGIATLRIVPKLLFMGQGWAREVCRIGFNSRDQFDFLDLFFNVLEEERIIILAFPGFEPTHLCDPSVQKRL